MAGIMRLDPAVVNRIAAGEVIQRPSNALKELLENSLDAGAKSIAVTAKEGGLASLSITDSGHGIARGDFALVCERFATSKLKAFEDLATVATYGFRGEALASISHVAKVTITSRTAGSPGAYRCKFADGRMLGEPAACAGVVGTIIVAESMFHNVHARRAALGNLADEYARILDVVQRYAIQHSYKGVAFSCMKVGGAGADVRIVAGTSPLMSIANIFGEAVKRELVPISAQLERSMTTPASFTASGFISGPNLALTKGVFILFINSRLVDCGTLRTAIEVAYAEVLPKGKHPFIYLSIELPLQDVDVNVHPTKREVGFLYEEELVGGLVAGVKALLAGANTGRVFATQTVLQINEVATKAEAKAEAALALAAQRGDASAGADDARVATPWVLAPMMAAFARGGAGADDVAPKQPAKAPQKVVRVDHRAHGTMDAFLVQKAPAAKGDDDGVAEVVFLEGGGGGQRGAPCTSTRRRRGNASMRVKRTRRVWVRGGGGGRWPSCR